MTRGYPHVSLWTTLACAGGTPVRRLPAWLDWSETHRIEEGMVSHRFAGTLPTDAEGTADIVDGMCIRVVRSASDVREYIVEEVRDGANDGGRTAVTALGVEFLLATLGLTTATSIEADPEDAVDAILADAPAWLVTGTVTPSATIDVEAVGGGTTFGKALSQLVEACRRNDEPCEVWLSRTDDTEYLVNVSAYGSANPTVDLPYQTGISGLTRTRPRSARLSHAVDESAGLAASYWYVDGVTSTTVTTSPLQPGIGAAIEADQWNGYALRDNEGNLHTITDTEVLNARQTRFTMSASTPIVAGDLVELVLASGDPILLMTLPSISAPIPLIRSVQTGADPWTNLAYNGAFRWWNGSGPLGFTGDGALSSSRATATGAWKRGGSSCQLPNTGDHYVQQLLTFYAPVAGAIHYAYDFKPVSNSEYMFVSFWDPDTGSDAGEENSDLPPKLGNGQWYERTRSYNCPMGSVTVGLTIRNNGGGEAGERASLYVDSVGIYYAPALPQFREGSGPGRAIAAGNLALSQLGGVQSSYAVKPLDLAGLDPDGAGKYRTLQLGGMARVRCTPLGIDDTVRVVEYTEPGTTPEALALTLDSRLRTLTSALGGGVSAVPTFDFGQPPLPGTATPSVVVTPPLPANMIVGDGGTTVDPCHAIEFTSGATVTDAGAGLAEVAVSGGGGFGPAVGLRPATLRLTETGGLNYFEWDPVVWDHPTSSEFADTGFGIDGDDNLTVPEDGLYLLTWQVIIDLAAGAADIEDLTIQAEDWGGIGDAVYNTRQWTNDPAVSPVLQVAGLIQLYAAGGAFESSLNFKVTGNSSNNTNKRLLTWARLVKVSDQVTP